MRLIAVLLLINLSITAYGQTADYFANDPKWVCELWNSNQWGPPPNITTVTTYVYYLNGDTIIGGNTFHRLFETGETHYIGPIPNVNFNRFTGYYLRQDNKSIRFYTNPIGIDSLLVSYDYQVGDTVKGNIFQACYPQSTIQKIDSILINSEYRLVFYLDTITGPVITEGIGHQVFINQSMGEFILPLCQGIGFDYSIYCYGQGNIPLWDYQGTNGNCILNLAVEENEIPKLSIYPNPFDNFIYVKTNANTDSEISIYDISSRLIIRKSFVNEIHLQTSFIDNGIYFYEVRFNNGKSAYGKLVKE